MSRSAARATSPSATPNGRSTTSSACTIARQHERGRLGVARVTSRDSAWTRAAASSAGGAGRGRAGRRRCGPCRGRPSSGSSASPTAATACSRASTCRGAVRQVLPEPRRLRQRAQRPLGHRVGRLAAPYRLERVVHALQRGRRPGAAQRGLGRDLRAAPAQHAVPVEPVDRLPGLMYRLRHPGQSGDRRQRPAPFPPPSSSPVVPSLSTVIDPQVPLTDRFIPLTEE